MAQTPSPVIGTWLGTLEVGPAKLRIQLQVKNDSVGKESCTLDSVDQGAAGIPCGNLQFADKHLSFEIPAIRGRWSGTLSENGNELDGTWTQVNSLPLKFTRQAAALKVEGPKPPAYDAAMPPVPVAELKTVMDRDLAAALKDGPLAPATNGGVAIGVVQHGVRRVFVYGPVQENSIFEIGSISKTFTGLILAQMVEQQKVKFDEPVRQLLPPGTVAKPDGAEITLLDLATQHSGLPRMPDNFHPAHPEDPYVDYAPANLYEFLAKHGVSKPAATDFNYSNLGFGLLGQALCVRAAVSYPELLKTEITGPLELQDTVVHLSPEQEKRFTSGYSAQHQAVHPWNLDALAGAGAIRSTAADMLTYLEAQLHPESVKQGTLSKTLQLTHELHADAGPAMKIGLAWLFITDTGVYWHNGGTGGFSSYALFNPKEDYAAVVLFNTTLSQKGSFADKLGQHIAARLSGKPAISLVE